MKNWTAAFNIRFLRIWRKKSVWGWWAAIPFGNGNRGKKGICDRALSQTPKFAPEKIKSLSRLCSGEETTEARLVSLAAWMRERYGSTMAQALKTVIPVRGKVKPKEKRRLYLNIDREEAEKLAESMEKSRCKGQARLVRALLKESPLDYSRAAGELGITSVVLKPLVQQKIVKVARSEISRVPDLAADVPREPDQELTASQEEALDIIRKEWKQQAARPVLLYGITGSGKNPDLYEADRRNGGGRQTGHRTDP